MRIRFAIAIVIALAFSLLFAGTAFAQSSFCSSLKLSVTGAPAGSPVDVSGATDVYGDPVVITWDGPPIASVKSDVSTGNFDTSFTVPAGAAPGSHTVVIYEGGAGDIMCPATTFVVLAAISVPPPVNVQTTQTTPTTAVKPPASSLPVTGFFLIPAGALIAGGLGMTIFGKRRR